MREIIHISKTFVDINTLVDWTIIGGTGENLTHNSNILLSLHVNDTIISQIWELGTIGIRDPLESERQQLLDSSNIKNFENNLNVFSDGRYECSLAFKGELNYPVRGI